MRLRTRMIVALAITVLAAPAFHFVSLNGKRSAHDEVRPADQHFRSQRSLAYNTGGE